MLNGLNLDDVKIHLFAVIKSNLIGFNFTGELIEKISTQMTEDILDIFDNLLNKNNPENEEENNVD